MRKNSYQQTINKIKASDSFKTDTILKMQKELKKDKAEVILPKHKYRYKALGTIAACFTIILSIAILMNQQKAITKNKPNVSNNNLLAYLPKLTISPKLTPSINAGGMGFDGYMAYSIGELENGNPWTPNNELSTMPVFKNTSIINSNTGRELGYLTADKMIEKAQEVANTMELSVNEIYTNPREEDMKMYEEKTGQSSTTTPYEAIAICDGITIKVHSNGSIRILYEPSLNIPSEYSFTYTDTNAAQAKNTLEYLINEYSSIVNMKSPALSLFGDYNYDGKRSFQYSAYENHGNLLDKILGYNFDTISFAPNENGGLWIIDRHKTNLSEIIGNYPIVTVNEAKKLLMDGHYITTAPEDLPDEKYIAKSELIYHNSPYDEVLMPYYRFLVEIPTMKLDNGLKTYGAYYVPAVNEEYLTNMPTSNGSFN